MEYFEDNSQSIGVTPLVRLNRVVNSENTLVLAKIEGRNPAYSVKCRIGASMIWAAEKAGYLGKGVEVGVGNGVAVGIIVGVAVGKGVDVLVGIAVGN